MATELLRHDQEFTDYAALGGKARALARLQRSGLPIPEWFVVPPSFASRATDASELRLSEENARVIVAMARTLVPTAEFFAVRSSSLEEDGTGNSFAGQFESFLFVPPEKIPAMIEAVWRSGFSERVAAYRRERALPDGAEIPSVLVQRMIDAESAGVAFSADPVSGRRSWAIVSAVFGVGSALVSGATDADTFTVGRDSRVLHRAIARKSVAHRAAPGAGEGVKAEPVPAPKASLPALTDEQVLTVATMARSAETHFGRPQDIEWALSGGRIWLLQSRPITSLHGLADPEGELNLWDNANIAESYSGVTTPLTFSFARGIYEAVYRQFAHLMGVSARRVADNRDLFPRMLGLIDGQIYYNLISWYRLLALLPGFSVNRGFMEQMMGVKEGLPLEVLAKLTPAGRWAKIRDAFALAGACGGLIRNHFSLPRQIKTFHARLAEALKPLPDSLERMRPDELGAHYRDLERKLLLKWDAPLVNDFFAMIFYGVLRKLTAKWCADPDGVLPNDLLCGEGGMISVEPAKRVRELAALVAGDTVAVTLLCTGSRREIEIWLAAAPEFRARYEAYLEKFGDRCLEELKLESLTLHDEPMTLLRSIGQFARRFGTAGLVDRGTELELRERAEATVAAALAGSVFRRKLFGWVLHHTRSRVRERENLRFERTRLFGRVRRICLELGKRFYATGKLAAPRDVFYLTIDELLGYIEGTSVTMDLAGMVALRQHEFAGFRAQTRPADRFETRGGVYLGNAFRSAQAKVIPTGAFLKGTGCCPGVVRGRARVILDPRQAVIESGEILVAPRTDPGWIMLFPAAAGLLVEHGSLLSHSAIVAREMGIPAIVSIGGLIDWVQTGEWLELDGSTGVVKKIGASATTPLPSA